MPKFYTHDIEASRKFDQQLMNNVQKMFLNDRSMQLAERNRLVLIDVVDRGIPDCYDNFVDFLYDFYPNFSWNNDMVKEVEYIMNHESFTHIVDSIKEVWDYDMRKEFEDAVAEG